MPDLRFTRITGGPKVLPFANTGDSKLVYRLLNSQIVLNFPAMEENGTAAANADGLNIDVAESAERRSNRPQHLAV